MKEREQTIPLATDNTKEIGFIVEWLLSHNWTPDGKGCAKDEVRVELSGEYGYLWSLQRFTDADIDGVATGRWQDLDIEGDTLKELLDALRKIATEASERQSDARAAQTRNWPGGHSEHTTGSKADDLQDRSEE
jgi:hypothetical protein